MLFLGAEWTAFGGLLSAEQPESDLSSSVHTVSIDDAEIGEGTLLAELCDRRLHQRGAVNAIAFSPDGRRLATTGVNEESTVRIWSTDSGEQIQELFPSAEGWGWYDAVTFSPDGQYLLGGNTRGELDIWDVLSGKNVYGEKRHKRTIHALAMSSDGTTFATAGKDGWLRVSPLDDPDDILWEKEFEKSSNSGAGAFSDAGAASNFGIGAVAFLPKQKQLIAQSRKRESVLILDADRGDVVREIPIPASRGTGMGFGGSFSSFLLTPDGKQLITGGNRMMRRDDVPQEVIAYSKEIQIAEAKVWSLATAELIRDLTKDRWEMGWGLSALSPDGKLLTQAHCDKVQILDSQTGREIRSITLPGHPGRAICFSPDGTLIATGNQHAVAMFDVETGHRLFTDEPWTNGSMGAVAYTPGFELNDDDKKLFQRFGSLGNRMQDEVAAMAKPMIVTAGADGRVHFWNAATHEHLREDWLGPHSAVRQLAVSQNGRVIAACGQTRESLGADLGSLVIWQLDGRQSTYVIPLPRDGRGVAVSQDGTKIVAAYSSGSYGDTRLELWELNRLRRIAEFPRNPHEGLSQYTAMRFSPDGRFVFVAEQNGTVTQWDTTQAAQDVSFVADWRDHVQTEKPEKAPWMGDACFSSDGKRLVTTTRESVFIWDMQTRKLQTKIVVPGKRGFRIVLSPDGTVLAATEIVYAGESGENKIRVFELSTGRHVLDLPLTDDRAVSLSFSTDSQTLVTGLTRGTALVWDVGR